MGVLTVTVTSLIGREYTGVDHDNVSCCEIETARVSGVQEDKFCYQVCCINHLGLITQSHLQYDSNISRASSGKVKKGKDIE